MRSCVTLLGDDTILENYIERPEWMSSAEDGGRRGWRYERFALRPSAPPSRCVSAGSGLTSGSGCFTTAL